MRIKIDENLPAEIARELTALGHDTDTSVDEDLGGKPDSSIWAAAQGGGRFLITQDLDFSDIRRYAPGAHHGILLLRLRNASRARLTRRVVMIFQRHSVEWEGCFVVATDRKIRVRRPG